MAKLGGWERCWVEVCAIAGVAVLLGSCSLEGLDHFPFPVCGSCSTLNVRDHIDESLATTCQLWDCDRDGRFCTFGPRDRDHDTHIARTCGGDDCDDTNDMSSVAGTEICNGRDDDCNGLIDDAGGAMVRAEAAQVIVSGVTSPTFSSIERAEDGVLVAWRSGARARSAIVTQIATETPSAMLDGRTNANAFHALTDATSAAGCPDQVLSSLAPTPCGTCAGCPVGMCTDGHCALPDACQSPTVCVTAADGTSRICEPPIAHNTPPHAGECMTHDECQDGIACNGYETCSPTSAPILIDARGCRAAASPDPCGDAAACDEAREACLVPANGPCAIDDLAAAPIGADQWMCLALDLGHCGAGRVRPGSIEAAAPNALSFWGDGRWSTTWLGVDLDGTGCTGASRAAGEPAGASGVSVAALPRVMQTRDFAEALAAWRAAPAASATAPVEILGLWREDSSAGSAPIAFVDGTGNGIPVRLADTTTSARIGSAAWSFGTHAGFVVAYARTDGGVSVSSLASFVDPAPECPRCTPADAGAGDAGTCSATPMICEAADPGPDTFYETADDGPPQTRVAASAVARTTPALGAPISTTLDASSTVQGNVAIAVGVDATSTLVPIVLAWATATEVIVARATIDPTTGVITDGDRVRMPAVAAFDVGIVYAPTGVAVAGTYAGVTVPAGAEGGSVIAWATTDGTYAARIADFNGALVPPGVVRIGDASTSPRPFLDRDASSLAVRVAAHQGDAFVAFPSVCGPPA